ncbi:hypothetical protein KC851_02245 [Candidatus Kaiserbacteria bacterium]|nr:hypothetical protein [Candidatus Kaiserbacteria bacterium]
MINRKQVEAILKINGITPASPDDEIRAVLMSARYQEDEIDSAIMVLRQNVKTKEAKVQGLHKVFRSDETLKPSEISALLGIDLELTDTIKIGNKTTNNSSDLPKLFTVAVLSFLFAAVCIFAYMYLNDIGVFHPTAGLL